MSESSGKPERVLSEALRAQSRSAPDAGVAGAGASAPGLPARWILLLALMLGLATGSVVGLLSLL